MPRLLALVAIGCLAALAAACSPALDWRRFVPEGSGIEVTFPCRPDRQERALALADAPVRVEMLVCNAEGMTFALTFVAVAEPGQVGPGLLALRQLAAANIGAAEAHPSRFDLPGMTPNDHSGRIVLAGHLPDGRSVGEHAAFFSRGLRLYQATVIGSHPLPAAVENFFGGFTLQP
ncbi:MAG: hypothetical protein M3O01_09010 [Pseudomonadota bacterium]|nr:hypothetical protein [Pseudomonadota bacterium]